MNDTAQPPPSASVIHQHRRRALIFLAGGLALVFALATSLPNLTLWPGQPFSLPALMLRSGSAGGASADNTFMTIYRILVALAFALLPVAVIWALINKERRKRLVLYLLTLALLYWLTGRIVPQNRAPQNEGPLPTARLPAAGAAGTAQGLPKFVSNPSDTAVWLVTLAVVLLLVAGAISLTWWLRKQQRPSTLRELADDAQDALAAIQAGGPLEETILRCYRDMCTVLQRERNLERASSMTPTEFVRTLQGKGLPIQPFQQLTRLFEDLRYGAGLPGPHQEQQAIDSLTAIVAACGSRRAA